VNTAYKCALRKAAVGSTNDVLTADHTSKARQSLSHQLGMFDDVGVVRDDARDEHFAIR
jgi:hypothetical protein